MKPSKLRMIDRINTAIDTFFISMYNIMNILPPLYTVVVETMEELDPTTEASIHRISVFYIKFYKTCSQTDSEYSIRIPALEFLRWADSDFSRDNFTFDLSQNEIVFLLHNITNRENGARRVRIPHCHLYEFQDDQFTTFIPDTDRMMIIHEN